MEEHCENCRWYKYSKTDQDMVCVCSTSKHSGDEMDEKDWCEKWSGKKQ